MNFLHCTIECSCGNACFSADGWHDKDKGAMARLAKRDVRQIWNGQNMFGAAVLKLAAILEAAG
jgi:hypothetical protein